LLYYYLEKMIKSEPDTKKRQELKIKQQFKMPDSKRMTFYDIWTEFYAVYKEDIVRYCIKPEHKLRESLFTKLKHTGDYPNADAFEKVFPNVQSLIVNFVDTEGIATLKNISNIGEGIAWRELYSSCDYFREKNRAYYYILLTNKLGQPDLQKEFFGITWDLVLDFEPDSSLPNGLLYDYKVQNPDKPPRTYVLNTLGHNPKVSYSSVPHWLQLNGDIDDPIAKPQEDKTLARRHIQTRLRGFIDAFLKEYNKPAIVIVANCAAFPISTIEILSIINSVYDGEGICFKLLSDNRFFSNSDVAKFDDILRYDLSVKDFLVNVKEVFAGPRKSPLLERKMPDNKILPEVLYQEVLDYVEPVFIGIENIGDENPDDTIFNFYTGRCAITWKMLKNNVDVIRHDQPMILRNLREWLSQTARPIKRLAYMAGAGGSTFMRRIAYELHRDYPTVIVNNYLQDDTAKSISKIYEICKNTMQVLIDCNNIVEADAKRLHEDLQSENIPFVVVFITRRNSSGGTADLTLGRFNINDCEEIEQRLLPYIENNDKGKKCRENLRHCIEKGENDEEHVPFVLSMYAFDENFKGIQPFVLHTLEYINGLKESDKYQDILFVLVLADWANARVDESYFDTAYSSGQSRLMKAPDHPLETLISHEEFRDKNIRGRFRIRYNLYTEYLLRYFSGRKDRISFVEIKDRIISFIRRSRPNKYRTANKAVVDLLCQLFISRSNYITDDNTNDEKYLLKAYSPLIAKMVSESRRYLKDAYNPVESEVALIFKELCVQYQDEPHFFAHLARFYFYTAKDFELGFEAIDRAIEISDDQNEFVDASLYHMKGMGFKIYVTDRLMGELNTIKNNKRKLDEEALRSELSGKISDILQYSEQAFRFFEKSHDGDPNSIYSAYAEARFRIYLQRYLFNNIYAFSAEHDWPAFIDTSISLRNIEALAGNIDECEHLLVINYGSSEYNAMQDDVNALQADYEILKADNEETIALCKQYLENQGISDKAPYRRILARALMKGLNKNYNGAEQQSELRNIISLMEENIALNPGDGANVRIWFEAVRHLEVEDSSEVLTSALQKLNLLIEGGKAPAEAYFYRYIVKFIYNFETGAIDSDISRNELSQCLADLKKIALRSNIRKRTIPLEWLGRYGKGLRRLIPSKEFGLIDEKYKVDSLELLQGRLPSRQAFERNQKNAYLRYRGNEVFFSPLQISGKITARNENAHIDFGMGFSYDGLRSYHDSIQISKAIRKEDITGNIVYKIDDVCNVEVTGHNTAYVQAVIVGSGGERVQIHKTKLKYVECEDGEWPATNNILLVRLDGQTNHNGETIWNASTTSPYIVNRK